MAYLGRAPANGFHSIQTISGDGSTTTFTLDYTVASDTAIIVSNNAVVLEPAHGYSLAGGGTSIVFSSAPASNVRTYVQFLGIAFFLYPLAQLLSFTNLNLISLEIAKSSFLTLIPIFLGLYIGQKIRKVISERLFQKFFYYMLLMMSLIIIISLI